MTTIKAFCPMALYLFFALIFAGVILITGLYLYRQTTQADDVITIRSAREGVTLTVATPERWGR